MKMTNLPWGGSRMRARVLGLVAILLQGAGCGTPHVFTVTIYDSPDRVVRLQTLPEANQGKAFNHPAYLTEEKLAAVMRGLQVEFQNTGLPLMGGSLVRRSQAFSDAEIKFFAPLLAKGLAQATPEEIVTFFETAEISDLHQITTSGGVYVEGDEIHVLLSNYSVKTTIWQDNEQYEAPYRLRPMEPMDPQPGRLVFDPPHLMTHQKRGLLSIALKAEPWQVGVRYKELK